MDDHSTLIDNALAVPSFRAKLREYVIELIEGMKVQFNTHERVTTFFLSFARQVVPFVIGEPFQTPDMSQLTWRMKRDFFNDTYEALQQKGLEGIARTWLGKLLEQFPEEVKQNCFTYRMFVRVAINTGMSARMVSVGLDPTPFFTMTSDDEVERKNDVIRAIESMKVSSDVFSLPPTPDVIEVSLAD